MTSPLEQCRELPAQIMNLPAGSIGDANLQAAYLKGHQVARHAAAELAAAALAAADAALAAQTDIAEKLKDPVLVHAAMLRGEIAKPDIRDMLHAYGADALARWDAALAAQSEPVACVTECEACFTPDACQLRGKCDHYAAEQLRVKKAPLYAAPVAAPVAQPPEPDMRHPKIQRLIGAKARCEIELGLVEQLVEDPSFDATSMGMEYWGPLHDRLKAALEAAPVAQPPDEISPEFTDTARAALLWVLWHHQGGSSPIGQPLRFALGMDAHSSLNEWQIADAKRWAALTKSTTAEFRCAAPVAQPLTDEQIRAIHQHLCNTEGSSYMTMARAIERAHGIAPKEPA